MRDNNIKIEPFDIIKLLSFNGEQEINEHGVITFTGIIPNEKETEYLSMAFGLTWIDIYILDPGGGEQLWFKGVITSLEIESDHEVKVLCVTAKTSSCLMDVSLHTRSYQDPGTTYDAVLATYTNDYPSGGFIMKKGSGEAIDDLIFQYRETDWEFTKRLASHFNTVLIPDCQAGGVKYYFGVESGGTAATISTGTYKVKKDMVEYQYKTSRGADITEIDALYYLLRYRDAYKLGEQIRLNDKPLYICRISTCLEGHELYHTYYLKTLAGFQVPKEFNLNTIGASFYGTVLEIEKDQVKITLSLDENKDETGTRWFPYSTVYSTPDGTGWYAMPEIGDDIRMYIPDEDEAGAYVISSVHLEPSASDERVNPDFKSIMNKHKKEVLFTPDSLIFTNNDGMSIQLLDDEGIKIISDKTIYIQSDENINIASTHDRIVIMAPDEMLFQQGETNTHLLENITFTGAQVHLT